MEPIEGELVTKPAPRHPLPVGRGPAITALPALGLAALCGLSAFRPEDARGALLVCGVLLLGRAVVHTVLQARSYWTRVQMIALGSLQLAVSSAMLYFAAHFNEVEGLVRLALSFLLVGSIFVEVLISSAFLEKFRIDPGTAVVARIPVLGKPLSERTGFLGTSIVTPLRWILTAPVPGHGSPLVVTIAGMAIAGLVGVFTGVGDDAARPTASVSGSGEASPTPDSRTNNRPSPPELPAMEQDYSELCVASGKGVLPGSGGPKFASSSMYELILGADGWGGGVAGCYQAVEVLSSGGVDVASSSGMDPNGSGKILSTIVVSSDGDHCRVLAPVAEALVRRLAAGLWTSCTDRIELTDGYAYLLTDVRGTSAWLRKRGVKSYVELNPLQVDAWLSASQAHGAILWPTQPDRITHDFGLSTGQATAQVAIVHFLDGQRVRLTLDGLESTIHVDQADVSEARLNKLDAKS